jgi:hypothetical protein
MTAAQGAHGDSVRPVRSDLRAGVLDQQIEDTAVLQR